MLVGSGLKSELSMFIWSVMSCWFPSSPATCTQVVVLRLDTNQLLGFSQQPNKVRQDVLQLLKKGKNSQRGMDLWILALILPSSFSFTFCPIPRIPTKRFLAPTPILWSTHWITQVSSSQTPTNADFYLLLILQLRPPLSIIFLQHQPLISPGFKQNTKLAII